MRVSSFLRVGRERGLNAAPLAARYLTVGAICAALSNVLLVGLSACGLDYMTAAIVMFAPMVAIGFVLQTRFVFEQPRNMTGLLRYAGAMLANQPMWLASLYLLCGLLRLPVAVAGPVATVWMIVWNFLATRWAVAHKRGSGDKDGSPSLASGIDA